MIDLARTQDALREHGLDAWVLSDFRGSNPVLWHLLGAEPRGTTRRLLLVIGADGEPALLTSALDRDLVAGLGVPLVVYRRWEELHGELRARAHGRVAMEYSPGGALPIVSWADAGTVELVRSFGAEVVSSGDLFAELAAAWDAAAEASHEEAVRHVVEVRDRAFALVRERLGEVRETEVEQLILQEFERRGLETEGRPAVAAGPHSGNPHHEPSDAVIGRDDVLLLDLWARLPGERHVFGDVTWTAYTGPVVPADVQAAFDAVRAGRDAAVESVRAAWHERRPLMGFEPDRVCRQVIEAAGFGDWILHRTGHSLGPGPRVHGLGANLDDFETHDERLLLPGAGFTVEPGVYGPAFGIRLECDVHLHPRRGPVVTSPLQTELLLLS